MKRTILRGEMKTPLLFLLFFRKIKNILAGKEQKKTHGAKEKTPRVSCLTAQN